MLDGNIGGIVMGNTVLSAASISLNSLRASRSGSTWTIEGLPGSQPSSRPTLTPEPAATPTVSSVRAGTFSEFDGASAATWRRMHEGGQILACFEGLALPRDGFCLSEGFRFTSDYSQILDAEFLVAHLPDGDALILQGNTTSRAGGDIRLGWITFEDRVITHLEFIAPEASTAEATDKARPTEAPTPERHSSDGDRAVLVTLYQSTGGANWDINTNWLSDRPIGEWHGVTTNSDGRVTDLILPGNNLTGTIPADLGELAGLSTLNLGRYWDDSEAGYISNQLTGSIPSELGDLIDLRVLDLAGNSLAGPIPLELASLSNLTWMSLRANQLTGEIPPQLGLLSNLTYLLLASNRLTGEIPPELGSLTNLTRLGLYGNRLRGEIPPELGRLSNLTHLWLSDNELTGEIPPQLGRLSHLKVLQAADNRLKGAIPPELGHLLSLEALVLPGNQLNGKLPPELGGLSNLTLLELSRNELTGEIPPELGDLSNLTHLSLYDNRLTGAIPLELANLSKLERLRISDNELTGCVPEGLRDVTESDLGGLDLSDCGADTPDPTAIANSDRASLIALYSATDGSNWENNTNWLSDRPLRDWHGVDTDSSGRVILLNLSENGLQGEIPSELGELSEMAALDLSYNRLTGTIPSELGDLIDLRRLQLGGNNLEGEVPSELGNLINLTVLDLGENRLSGQMPSGLGNLTELMYLSLEVNQLVGELPSDLGKLTDLTELRLGWNTFTGGIPSEFTNLTNLTRLDIRHNSITDISSLSDLVNLRETILSDNRIADAAPLAANSGLRRGDLVDVRNNPLSEVSIDTHIPALKDRGVTVYFDDVLVLNEPRIYNDNVFVLQVAGDISGFDVPVRDYAATFYEHFNDDFDFLVFVANLGQGEAERQGAFYSAVRNAVSGIGQPIFSDDGWSSAKNLQGVISLNAYVTYDFEIRGVKWSTFVDGTVRHELIHRWANYVVPTGVGAHWGFSSADGQLGGFDIANLVDRGNGRYTAGYFETAAGRTWGEGPYSEIELYLAGYIPAEQVPDLWVAEDGEWLLDQEGSSVLADNGYPMFTANRVRTYSIDDIIAEHGARIPDASQAQKDFRAAVILLVDESHPATRERLERLSADVSWFSHPGEDEAGQHNFYEATGGRGTITMDGLSLLLRSD